VGEEPAKQPVDGASIPGIVGLLPSPAAVEPARAVGPQVERNGRVRHNSGRNRARDQRNTPTLVETDDDGGSRVCQEDETVDRPGDPNREVTDLARCPDVLRQEPENQQRPRHRLSESEGAVEQAGRHGKHSRWVGGDRTNKRTYACGLDVGTPPSSQAGSAYTSLERLTASLCPWDRRCYARAVIDPLRPGILAIIGGIGVAVLAFIPFVALSYRRRGGLTVGRTLVWLALAIYGLAIWTYTLLPLPSTDSIRCVQPQLNLLAPVGDILSFDTGSPRAILTNPAVLQLAFNVLLFAPLGFFVRMILRRGVLVATGIGFAVSLAVELTQLTGIWGLYACAYRIFDVADLATNTVGAVLGSMVAIAFVHRRVPRSVAPIVAAPVTITRRVLAILCDVLFLTLVGGFAAVVWRTFQLYVIGVPLADAVSDADLVFTSVLPLALQLWSVLRTGATLGEHAVLLRAVDGPRRRVVARPLRFLAGIGGYGILSTSHLPLGGLALFALIVATVVSLFRPGSGRSFAAGVAGTGVVDSREDTGVPVEIRREGDITPEAQLPE
jgi:glycopeptide antibiotics resistance protein